jgi:hypothetical protein
MYDVRNTLFLPVRGTEKELDSLKSRNILVMLQAAAGNRIIMNGVSTTAILSMQFSSRTVFTMQAPASEGSWSFSPLLLRRNLAGVVAWQTQFIPQYSPHSWKKSHTFSWLVYTNVNLCLGNSLRVPTDKLLVAQLAMKLPALYGSRGPHAVPTRSPTPNS